MEKGNMAPSSRKTTFLLLLIVQSHIDSLNPALDTYEFLSKLKFEYLQVLLTGLRVSVSKYKNFMGFSFS
jgi:hypothetical protein